MQELRADASFEAARPARADDPSRIKSPAAAGITRRRARLCAPAAGLLLVLAAAPAARAESLTFERVLAEAARADPALRIARLELARAQLETDRVESRLGWVASGELGLAHDANIFGVPVDRLDATAGFERRLASGSTVGIGVGAAREESETSLFPFLPNPADTTRADASYRLPLRQGAGGVAYEQALETAAAGIEAAQAELGAAGSRLAREAADLFYAAALTYERLQNAHAAVERAERLQRFIERNIDLGIAEEKDRLQAEAQLRARVAESRALRAQWENQRVALNRLMERPPGSDWMPAVAGRPGADLPNFPALESRALAASYELEREQARLRAAEAAIARTRDAVRDQVDLVFSVGGRHLSGDIPAGEISESEAIAALRLEYRAALDDRGAAAELAQAHLARDAARERLETVRTDLRYIVARLAAEIEALEAALAQALAARTAEREKLDEATRRYRAGRADTAELIQFENDFEAATLAAEQRAIELARRIKELENVTGEIWRGVGPPLARAGR